MIAFLSVAEEGANVVLDNLWVAPEHIGEGIGLRACEYIFNLAREHGWKEVLVLPDPPAEGFYKRVGFVDTGERVQSRVPGGPLFSILVKRIT